MEIPESAAVDDDALIASAIRASDIFADLWTGNSGDGEPADIALAKELASFTARDCERIDRLMHKSGIARDEWYADGGKYLARIIRDAVSAQGA